MKPRPSETRQQRPPAAIANAVADAAGVRLFELPITAEKIYHAPNRSQEEPESGKVCALCSSFYALKLHPASGN
jgi:hypothetical protein